MVDGILDAFVKGNKAVKGSIKNNFVEMCRQCDIYLVDLIE